MISVQTIESQPSGYIYVRQSLGILGHKGVAGLAVARLALHDPRLLLSTTSCSEVVLFLQPTGVWSFRQCRRTVCLQPDPLLTHPSGARYLRGASPDPGKVQILVRLSGCLQGLLSHHWV